jgi:hypothetical protein
MAAYGTYAQLYIVPLSSRTSALKINKLLGQLSGIFDFNQDYSTAPIDDDLPVAIDSTV